MRSDATSEPGICRNASGGAKDGRPTLSNPIIARSALLLSCQMYLGLNNNSIETRIAEAMGHLNAESVAGGICLVATLRLAMGMLSNTPEKSIKPVFFILECSIPRLVPRAPYRNPLSTSVDSSSLPMGGG